MAQSSTLRQFGGDEAGSRATVDAQDIEHSRERRAGTSFSMVPRPCPSMTATICLAWLAVGAATALVRPMHPVSMTRALGCRSRIVTMAARKKQKAPSALAQQPKDETAETELLERVGESKRDMTAIDALIDKLVGLGQAPTIDLVAGAWSLQWVPTAEALESIGTGLHTLPGTSFEDFFLSIGSGKAKKCEVRARSAPHLTPRALARRARLTHPWTRNPPPAITHDRLTRSSASLDPFRISGMSCRVRTRWRARA